MPQPPFLPETQRTKKQVWNRTTNLIVFPVTSKSPAPVARKRGASNLVEMTAAVASNVPALIEDVKLDIAAKWRRGVRIAYLAKIHQLTVRQVEAIIWMAYHSPRRAA